jgi:hypothetical protein
MTAVQPALISTGLKTTAEMLIQAGINRVEARK